MNVLHLDLGREWRGGQRQVVYLARALAREGYGVTIAAPLGVAHPAQGRGPRTWT